ncbi:sarcosine oxidase subunit gamma [Salipiger sp. CCB-MM3]|uniref:sarcosine oxidase subunit gamma n=1 Tax=Salipiger sp. CCB-MM3 TaxID=1792508 RepID=UPI000AB3837E|nr:sarcosine oxidase subunit gamma family protein [Salipiger sp. CCB-MM3]
MSEITMEPMSPLMGAVAEGAITLREMGPCGMVSLRGAFDHPAFAGPVEVLAGCALPGRWQVSGTAERGLLWMSPDELLLLLPHGEAAEAARRLQAELDDAGAHALVLDVSDMRVRLSLTGGCLRETLARLTPTNMAPAAFPVGALRRTRLSQAAAAIWLVSEEEAQIFAFRSVADYVFRLLAGAAKNGPDFEYF